MPNISLAALTEKIVADYQGRDCAPATIRQVKQVLRELGETGAAKSHDITIEAIARWKIAHPLRSNETTRSHLRCMSAICTIARHSGHIKNDPFDFRSPKEWTRSDARPPGRGARQYHRSAEEIRRVLSLATEEARESLSWESARLEAYVHCLFLTGARPGEVQHLLRDNFHPENRTITIAPVQVPGTKGKGDRWWRPKTVGSSATLPVGPVLAEVLSRWARRCGSDWMFPGKKLRGPWTTGGPGVRPLDQVRALGERAGVRDLVNKSARKSIGTHGKTMGLGGLERRDLFRHSDEKTGDFYDEERIESLRPAVAKVERFYLGIG